MTTRTEEYTAMSRELFRKAVEALEEDDLVQASEKLWGAAAQMVKAVAERRGWPHRQHRDLYRTVDRLAAETRDDGLTHLFGYASELHTNFYEHLRLRGFIEEGVGYIRELIDKLEAL